MSVATEVGAFSLFTGEHAADPFPLFARLRSMGAVVPLSPPVEGGRARAWAVTRMEEAVQVLRDSGRFTVDPRSAGAELPFGRAASAGGGDDTGFFTQGGSMLSVDEPDHRRLRGLVSRAFTPRYMEGLRPRVQEIADEL